MHAPGTVGAASAWVLATVLPALAVVPSLTLVLLPAGMSPGYAPFRRTLTPGRWWRRRG
jgi:hypothetical protein